MTTLVAIDAKEKTLTRYENGGGYPRKTHQVKISDAVCQFDAYDVQQFRYDPHADYAVARLCDDPNTPKAA